MGVQTAKGLADTNTALSWMLQDIHALAHMLDNNMFETGNPRIGAEQELFLVDRAWQPSPVALEMLDLIADPHFTT